MACRRCAKAAAKPTSRSSSGFEHQTTVCPEEPLSLSKGRLEGLRRRGPSRRGFDKLSPSSGRPEIRKGNARKLLSNIPAVVTGGASGIGPAPAPALERKRCRVRILDLRAKKV